MLTARPENQILICVARRSLDDRTADKLRQLLRSDLDWEYLLEAANRHCLIPLLYIHLSAIAHETVPERVKSRLGDANHENTQSSFFLIGELLKILKCFEANSIAAIPFKGPTLAQSVYGDVGLRQFADLDVLVHRRDVPRVKELLVSRGFKPTPDLTTAQQAALLRFDCAYNFDDGKGVVLDVHWDFVEPHSSLAFDPDPFWGRLEAITIGGNQLMTLSPEDLLLVLCLHGFTHFWERLGWICDVASLIDQKKDIDWQLVLANANRLGMRRILLLGLVLATDLLNATMPLEIRKVVSGDAVVKRLADEIQEQLFLTESPRPGLFGGAALSLNMRERKRDKLRFCFRLITTPRRYDWLALSLPDSLFFLYYLLRPLRLAGKYGARLFRGSDDRATPSRANRGALS
ncbi:MAG: hypothetical protein QOG23_4294 [Blastocatellia bacterium]|jgi:hypothetical protein|nr:hypothetical protein [Blastocatellia bacterium]